MYFRCEPFELTMPVTECERRRKKVKKRGLVGAAAADAAAMTGFMDKMCGSCTKWRELTAPENQITAEQMAEHIEQHPAHGGVGHEASTRLPHMFGYWPNRGY
jgi:type IV pilus biogenesis protein CpaD/CtpE